MSALRSDGEWRACPARSSEQINREQRERREKNSRRLGAFLSRSFASFAVSPLSLHCPADFEEQHFQDVGLLGLAGGVGVGFADEVHRRAQALER
jgi:hypothetical protein